MLEISSVQMLTVWPNIFNPCEAFPCLSRSWKIFAKGWLLSSVLCTSLRPCQLNKLLWQDSAMIQVGLSNTLSLPLSFRSVSLWSGMKAEHKSVRRCKIACAWNSFEVSRKFREPVVLRCACCRENREWSTSFHWLAAPHKRALKFSHSYAGRTTLTSP